MPFRLGPTELIIVLVIIMIVFGVGRLPEIGGSLGKSIKEFRKSVKDPSGDEEAESEEEETAEKKKSLT